MKLAAIYNVFDGEELLEYSINSIRQQVDLIIVVYQVISNFGDKNDDLIKILETLKKNGMIDILIEYEPQLDKPAKFNEIQKRVTGAERALREKCSHFIHMDSDELYDENQFTSAKQFLSKNPHRSSACHIYNYFKEPIYQMTPIEDFYVPFIQKLDERNSYAKPYPVLADPTRSVAIKNQRNLISRLWKKSYRILDQSEIFIFPESELVMHHYSWIRHDILRKISNSTNNSPPEKIKAFMEFWKNWQPGQKIVKPDQNPRLSFDVKIVENKFNISIN